MTRRRVCPSCRRGELIPVNDIISEFGGYVFAEKGERCTACGEEFPYEEESQKTIEVARRLGVWPEPLKLYRKLSRSGGTLVLRIPSDLERQMRLKEETEVAITRSAARSSSRKKKPSGSHEQLWGSGTFGAIMRFISNQ